MHNHIYPCLWFNGNAKEAADFYCSVFQHTAITSENPLVVTIDSFGQKFMLLNGGDMYKINPSISFFVLCETDDETEIAWEKLLEGGTVLMPLDKYDWSVKYGWVQDKFGASWQLSLGNIEDTGQKICPMLMFTGEQNGRADEAINFYTSIFENSSTKGIMRYGKNDNEQENNIMHAQFSLAKYVLMAMDSSYEHGFGFNEAISFVISCRTQEEIDYYWEKLSAIPEAEQCGWLKDRFGVSWQVVPAVLEELIADDKRAGRIFTSLMQMKKPDIQTLMHA